MPTDDEIVEQIRRKLAGELPRKPCGQQDCPRNAVGNERYCHYHRERMISQMQQDGYLQDVPPLRNRKKGMELLLTKEQRFFVGPWQGLDKPNAFDDLIRLVEGD